VSFGGAGDRPDDCARDKARSVRSSSHTAAMPSRLPRTPLGDGQSQFATPQLGLTMTPDIFFPATPALYICAPSVGGRLTAYERGEPSLADVGVKVRSITGSRRDS
jgi:hypothetical protein